jgi:hypothetical protein
MDILQGNHFPLLTIRQLTFPSDLTFYALSAYRQALPYLLPLLRQFYTLQHRFYTQLYPVLLPYLNTLFLWAHESPAIISVGALILFLLITMQIMNFFRRMMMFWVRIMWRIAFWGGLVAVGSVVYQRGLERTVNDAVHWGEQLAEVWWREYEGYSRASQPDYGRSGYKVKERDWGNARAGGRGRENWR